MRTARLAPEAEAELREAATWYKKGSPDVARRFLAEVRSLAREIARIPLRFPVLMEPELDPPVRRALVPGFPYALIFLVTADVVHVLAVAHQHRAPGYWIHRVRR
ncbi:type II toxin-antitoxin system RelE/ParE family toxin [Sorangium sp. So ce296]|uniref:type II toxin-antitoxin system RelE/ParE family toxin n=1 Tax=Sorangium sp. So ce296 TaxID=3133296 RepID=UPI003F62D2FA